MSAKKPIAGEIFEAGPCCIDQESGLFTPSHFRFVLMQELARLDRWERPLGLVILRISSLDNEGWRIFGRIILESLRRLDIAARLGEDQLAVLMPDADAFRLRRWLAGFLPELAEYECFAGLDLISGQALAHPWEGLGTGEFVAKALSHLSDAPFSGGELGTEDELCHGLATAIAADERSLLFAGFKGLEAG